MQLVEKKNKYIYLIIDKKSKRLWENNNDILNSI